MNLRRLRRLTPSPALIVLMVACFFSVGRLLAEPVALQLPEPADPHDLARFTTPSTSYYYLGNRLTDAEVVCFFPPDTPALDAPIPLANPLAAGMPPPPELAAHVHDLFYPQLAARLVMDELPRRQLQKLERYRTTRTALQSELLGTLASLQNADPTTRKRELEALDRRQLPQLQTLALLAEQLRAELGENLANRIHTRLCRRPHATDSATTLRSAAYFLDGLSTAQRRLLLAIAQDTENPPDTGTTLTMPTGAHLRLPAKHPVPLILARDRYEVLRNQLSRDLLAAIATTPETNYRDLGKR